MDNIVKLSNFPEVVLSQDPHAQYTETQVAQFLNVSPWTLQAWRSQGSGPPFIRCGRSIRYRRCDLIAWQEANSSESSLSNIHDSSVGNS